MSIKDIIKGHVNEALGKNEDMKLSRMNICRACPLFKETATGPVCNSALYLNTATDETSTVAKEGFTRGCGCRLNAKTRLPDAACPVGKW